MWRENAVAKTDLTECPDQMKFYRHKLYYKDIFETEINFVLVFICIIYLHFTPMNFRKLVVILWRPLLHFNSRMKYHKRSMNNDFLGGRKIIMTNIEKLTFNDDQSYRMHVMSKFFIHYFCILNISNLKFSFYIQWQF